MKKKYLLLVIVLYNTYSIAQNDQSGILKNFLLEKDSIIIRFLSDRIDTAVYRCLYQGSSGLYVFISKNKCYVYSKNENKIDELSEKFIFKIPGFLTVGEKKIDSLIINKNDHYSMYGSFCYFEKINQNTLIFNADFSSLMTDKDAGKIARNLFDLLGFARIKLGFIK